MGTNQQVSLYKLTELEQEELRGTYDAWQEASDDYVDWATWTKEVIICAQCGLYGAIPYNLGAVFNTFTSSGYNNIRSRNDLLAPIHNAVEVEFCSLYRHTEAEQPWINQCQINLYEALRKGPGKPIYAVINPRYHRNPSDPNVSPHQWHTKTEFMQMLNELDAICRGQRTVGPPGDLRTLRCDGVIIWNGSTNDWPIFRSHGWWDAVQDFLHFDDPSDPGVP
jgi:hypothetical protein